MKQMLSALALLALVSGPAHAGPDEDAIGAVLKGTWDRPGAPVVVEPVAIAADYAIAGWTQGDMGGRALLRRKGHAWVVVLCAGDQLKQAEALRMTGIGEDTARKLVAALAESESKVAPARVAMFSRFEGLVTMDEHGAHQHNHHH